MVLRDERDTAALRAALEGRPRLVVVGAASLGAEAGRPAVLTQARQQARGRLGELAGWARHLDEVVYLAEHGTRAAAWAWLTVTEAEAHPNGPPWMLSVRRSRRLAGPLSSKNAGNAEETRRRIQCPP
jgi:hypothetical protein